MPYIESGEATKFTYDTMLQWWSQISSQDMVKIDEALEQISLQYDVSKGEALVEILNSQGFEINKAADGTWRGSFYANPANINIPNNPINSNSSTISRGKFRQWYANKPELNASTGMTFLKPTRFPVSGGLGAQAVYTVGSVLGAVGAVSTGITLGKTIAPLLYQANPNYWDSIGVNQGSFNPETWSSLTNGSDSPFAGLFNLILGLDPTTGRTQAYMDENAFAYMALAMAQNGVFDAGHYESYIPTGYTPSTDIYEPIKTINISDLVIQGTSSDNRYLYTVQYLGVGTSESDMHNVALMYMTNDGFYTPSSPYYHYLYAITSSNDTANKVYHKTTTVDTRTGQVTTGSANSYFSLSNVTVNGQAFKMCFGLYVPISNYASWVLSAPSNSNGEQYDLRSSSADTFKRNTGYVALFGDSQEVGGVDGITNQPDATLPDVSTWDTVPNTLSSLQNQYPDLFSNPLVWDNVQPDGTNPQLRYIPVSMPDATSAIDTQPVSGNQTQTQTQIGNGISTDVLLQLITDLMTQTQPDTATQPIQQNPTDTGTGTAPTPLPPVGSASALWSVYHPTQAQVNSFGAWLWGSPFLTNIGKLFQNPIEGVISLHKVFVTPVDSGTGTIVVGTLDSGVSSATVNEQYIEVDCGSIDCYEEFGNVFDYDPYTKIALYLPFVGIVPLNVGDIMRSTINVKYGVDIFTGACIAMVGVSRDGNDAILYQYSGNCAVHYPLSNVQQSQLLSGLITVAAGIGAIVATGGAAAPAAATGIAGGAMSALHTNIGRSGGFSANAGAMGIKTPYLIIERPQTKIAETFPELAGYPTNYSCKLNECSGHVVVTHVHIEGINATDSELDKINNLLMSGVIV